jgi:hypothetical protein
MCVVQNEHSRTMLVVEIAVLLKSLIKWTTVHY